jgi:hypothetical protein
MTLNLSDDLRQAVQTEGTPLKLVDPSTGEIYLLYRESEEALARAQISNSRLLKIAKNNRPPKEWLEGDEESLF